jgi:diguanylate cyclase (GGDEF)-like protein/PAS domain S-box-containing protein
MRVSPILGRRLAVSAAVLLLPATFALCPWLLTNIFSSTYLPHGFCFQWNPRLIWLHVASDLTIWLCYTSIAITLALLVTAIRKQIPFKSVIFLFGTFILACGFTHLLDVVVLWRPLYWLQGDTKLLTASASLITALALPFFVPQIKAVLVKSAASAENERRFLAAVESSLDGLFLLHSVRSPSGEIVDFRFLFVNENAARMVSLTREQMIGGQLCELMPQNRTQSFFDTYRRVAETGRPHLEELPVSSFEGISAEWIKIQVVKLDDGVAVTASDISERKRLEAERADVFAASLIDKSPAAVIVTDASYAIRAINPAAQKMLWYQAEELIGRATPLIFYSHEEVADRAKRLSAASGTFVELDQAVFASGPDPGGRRDGEWTFFRKGGSTILAQVSVTPLTGEGGEPTGFMITAYDVSERKRREEYISHLAHHDVLTGLPTRQLLMDRLEMMLSRSRRFASRSALLMIDLNSFKNVNDSLGHHVGDRLLIQVAERMRGAVRAMDTVARMGGDEFVVLISDLESASAAEQVARKLLAAFQAPFALKEQSEIEVTASIGICVYPEGGTDANALLRNADIAMYYAKATRRHSYQLFDQKIAEAVVRQREMEAALAAALDAGELYLDYQPQFSLSDGSMVGVEALLRWNSRQFGPVSPSLFIPVAESSGLILPIGAWVIRTACRELPRLQRRFGSHLVMAVNLSSRQLEQPGLLEVIEEALVDNGLDPACFEMEITESVLMTESPNSTDFFKGLRELGARVAIDDFGTGFSSMAYLLRFSVNRLKIDRCFIQDSPSDLNSATVTSAIIALAHQLKVSVLAEGVESEAQMDFLRGAGCDDAQGFHLCRPMSPDLIASAVLDQTISS